MTNQLPVRLEIIPTDGIIAKVQTHVPAGSTLTVTCLPHHGVETTVRASVQLGQLGYKVIPHLAARSLESRAQLAAMLRDCEAAGITEVFAIGGDAPEAAGPYGNSGRLMEDIADLTGGNMAIGVAGYPEGHPKFNELQMLDALLEKQHLASNVVTQMCFSAPKIGWYAELLRREGMVLPIWAGVAGAVPRAKLISLATKIGVGPSLKFLNRKGPLARRLLNAGSYSSRSLVSELDAVEPALAGIHLYTFNNVETQPVVNWSGVAGARAS
ncbi:methylenetetrahydrofolate reductase [Arthrobacter globiformis]|uniref:methylenetetrahydrofolate reductase n=1 Tax=Arthrobacter globiformis TaxID=1665 RepID=UPI00279243B5|nr:methylenetetrahydrofolate reductase [Arthrobacter globiformis]MDQ0616362.1 methylenetetrahydrofolate reductase (NADPH) [Arthrobacter globiformis]